MGRGSLQFAQSVHMKHTNFPKSKNYRLISLGLFENWDNSCTDEDSVELVQTMDGFMKRKTERKERDREQGEAKTGRKIQKMKNMKVLRPIQKIRKVKGTIQRMENRRIVEKIQKMEKR